MATDSEDGELSSMSSTVSSIFSDSSGNISITSSSSGEMDDGGGRLRNKCVGRSKVVEWGFTSVIGRRKEMEDAVAVVPGFMSRTCDHVANFCAERMHEVIAEEWDQEAVDGFKWKQKWEAVLSSSFERADNEVLTEAAAPEIVGSTAIVAVLSGCQIIVSHCGDSRAVLCRGTETIPLTVDQKGKRFENCVNALKPPRSLILLGKSILGQAGHTELPVLTHYVGAHFATFCKTDLAITNILFIDRNLYPDREDELLRIEKQDGKVIYWNGARVLGVLAMSRAIGDRYLRPWIIPVPEITFTTRTDEDECLILASDGLWDVMTNNEVGEVARRILRRKRRSAATNGEPSAAQTLADSLTEIAMGRQSSDNISVVVVDLKSKKKLQKT
ncbi:protein phosphatase 2C 56 [Artemisia annua]|uniref:Protein phosphatase 2C 56 n=1 Tax=Artemisia annua TaxID=35608 RepID=A0A2U1KNV7_ARTAN|nr:protein phosphatase 2C 56 [Artemisia annua]